MIAPRGLQYAPSSRYSLHVARVAVLGWAGGDSRSVNNTAGGLDIEGVGLSLSLSLSLSLTSTFSPNRSEATKIDITAEAGKR